jgi:hypothetical protein
VRRVNNALTVLVGHVYAGRGFVPEGANLDDHPCAPDGIMAGGPDGSTTTTRIASCPSG